MDTSFLRDLPLSEIKDLYWTATQSMVQAENDMIDCEDKISALTTQEQSAKEKRNFHRTEVEALQYEIQRRARI